MCVYVCVNSRRWEICILNGLTPWAHSQLPNLFTLSRKGFAFVLNNGKSGKVTAFLSCSCFTCGTTSKIPLSSFIQNTSSSLFYTKYSFLYCRTINHSKKQHFFVVIQIWHSKIIWFLSICFTIESSLFETFF